MQRQINFLIGYGLPLATVILVLWAFNAPVFAQEPKVHISGRLIVDMDLTRDAGTTPAGFVLNYTGPEEVADCRQLAEVGTPLNDRFTLALIEFAHASRLADKGGTARISCHIKEIISTQIVAPDLPMPPVPGG